ncbi:hypothetical protein M885DRAFT_524670 [Pelagophyceae sp. CCMP2097]|nr:hypothetical protein M885DRAFT_524670 [Pelagophyceae sp. CCMP2097]
MPSSLRLWRSTVLWPLKGRRRATSRLWRGLFPKPVQMRRTCTMPSPPTLEQGRASTRRRTWPSSAFRFRIERIKIRTPRRRYTEQFPNTFRKAAFPTSPARSSPTSSGPTRRPALRTTGLAPFRSERRTANPSLTQSPRSCAADASTPCSRTNSRRSSGPLTASVKFSPIPLLSRDISNQPSPHPLKRVPAKAENPNRHCPCARFLPPGPPPVACRAAREPQPIRLWRRGAVAGERGPFELSTEFAYAPIERLLRLVSTRAEVGKHGRCTQE